MNRLDDLFQQMTEIVPSSFEFDLFDVLIVLTLSLGLALVIGKTYSLTHRGISYSQYFVHTLVLLSMLTSSVMLIVGSNIARAFTLLGALSIVRFRNAIKETRDVGFVFFAMAIGMACGTRFYSMAIVMTLLICLTIVLLTHFEFGRKKSIQSILRIMVPNTEGIREKIQEVLKEHLRSYTLVNTESSTSDKSGADVLNYVMVYKKNTDENALLNELKKLNDNRLVSILHGDHAVEV